ncbi:MAG: DUF1800 domain-containing protein [Pseudomonadota bacterium]
MMTRPRALTALTRFGLGPRPGEMAEIAGDPVGYLYEQLMRSDAAMVTGPDLKSREELRQEFGIVQSAYVSARRAVRAGGAGEAELAAEMAAREGRRGLVRGTTSAEVQARFDHGRTTDNPFVERLVLFWQNHFAIERNRGIAVRVTAGNYEREAIRPHVLGYFEDMLFAATTHPAMLVYLDNVRSFGPNSRLGKRRGIVSANENLAREVLELHTLGAGGGYSQADVDALADTLTGWQGGFQRAGSGLVFDERVHEPGPRTILGKRYTAEGDMQLEAVLPDLAAHPSTARFIATKFARHFVGDDASDALITALEKSFIDTEGDLRELAITLIESDEAWEGEPRKTVPPYDFIVASARATGAELPAQFVLRSARVLAQELWQPPSPAGWPSADNAFLGGDSLLERVDFARLLAQRYAKVRRVQRLAVDLFGDALNPFVKEALDRAEGQRQALVLLLMSPVFHRR